jgi:hypothetical protein
MSEIDDELRFVPTWCQLLSVEFDGVSLEPFEIQWLRLAASVAAELRTRKTALLRPFFRLREVAMLRFEVSLSYARYVAMVGFSANDRIDHVPTALVDSLLCRGGEPRLERTQRIVATEPPRTARSLWPSKLFEPMRHHLRSCFLNKGACGITCHESWLRDRAERVDCPSCLAIIANRQRAT